MISNRKKLWKLFKDKLISAGLDPEVFREDFDKEYQTIETESPQAQEQIVRALARFAVAIGPKHPLPLSIPAMRRVLQIRQEMDKAKETVSHGDRSSIESYIQRLTELKKQEEKIWHELSISQSEQTAKYLREKGRKVTSSTCLKCAKPLKYVIELERGLCMECYNRL